MELTGLEVSLAWPSLETPGPSGTPNEAITPEVPSVGRVLRADEEEGDRAFTRASGFAAVLRATADRCDMLYKLCTGEALMEDEGTPTDVVLNAVQRTRAYRDGLGTADAIPQALANSDYSSAVGAGGMGMGRYIRPFV